MRTKLNEAFGHLRRQPFAFARIPSHSLPFARVPSYDARDPSTPPNEEVRRAWTAVFTVKQGGRSAAVRAQRMRSVARLFATRAAKSRPSSAAATDIADAFSLTARGPAVAGVRGGVNAVLLFAMACSRRRRTLPRATNPPTTPRGESTPASTTPTPPELHEAARRASDARRRGERKPLTADLSA